VYGDMGVKNSHETIPRITQLAQSGAMDFILHVGDISYADDYAADKYEEIWETWFGLIQPVMDSVPYMVCPGNHEANCGTKSCDGYSGKFAAFNNRFRMPGNESGSNTNMFFSFNYGGIHFVAFDTETDFPGSPESKEGGFGHPVEWLKQDLAAVDRTKTPWIVMYGHRPIYSTSYGFANKTGYPQGSPEKLQKAIEDIMYDNKVDLYMCGHVHTYERDYPVYRSERVGKFPDKKVITDPKATIHLIAGSAGCEEGLSDKHWYDWTVGSEKWNWWAHRFGTDYGYGMLTVFNATHLHWGFFRSGDNGLEDEFYIVKTKS